MEKFYPGTVKPLLKRFCRIAVTVIFTGTLFTGRLYAQAPTLSYSSPQTLTTGTAMSLTPTSTGAASPGYNNLILGSGFNHPSGVAVDALGNVYVTDGGNLAVKKIPAGNGTPVTIYSGYVCQGIAVDALGNVIVANSDANTLVKIPFGGGSAVTLTLGLKSPMGVALDVAGNIYVTTRTDNSVYKIGPSGGPGALVASGFVNIGGVAIGNNGDIYIADNGANAIYKVPAAGGSRVKVADVMGPVGVALDGIGNIYAGDFTNARIVEIPADGSAQVVTASGYTQAILLTSDAFGNVYAPCYGASIVLEMVHSGGYYTSGLPIGLSLNNSTGVISGTPTASSVSKTYTVQAYNSSGSATANIGIQVVGTGLLSNLSISAGTLSPVFSPGTNSYSTNIPAGTGGLQILPKTADTNAVIKVNGTVVKSGTRSAPISLVQGSNNFSIVVTPANGAANTYTINANDPSSPLPAISYNTPQTYSFGTAITPLSPISSQVGGYSYNNDPVSSTPVGAYPVGIAADASGNLYINYYKYCLAKVPAGGGSPVIMSYNVSDVYQIVADAAGNVYGCNNKSGVLFKYPAAGGDPVTIASGLNFPGPPAMDPAGNFYIPQFNTNTIVKVPAGGGNLVTAYSIREPLRICFDGQGNAYISAFDGPELGDLYEYPAGGGARILIASDLNEVNQMAADNAGNVFVAGFNNYSMLQQYIAGSHQEVLLSSNQDATYGVAIDASGNAYAVNGQEMPVYKFAPTGGYFISGLPQGLSFDSNTGILSGTPTQSSPTTAYTVTAYNASGSATAPLSIKVVSNPDLKSILLSSGAFLAPFSPDLTNYSIGVSNDQSQYYVMPTAFDNTAVIKVNGITVASGTISQAIPLGPLTNNIPITVATADGSVKTYNLSVGVGSSSLSYEGPQTWYKNIALTPLSPTIVNPVIGAPGYYQTTIANGLSRPAKLTADLVGNIYVCDQNVLKKIPGDGSAITTIGTGIGTLTGVSTDAKGNIYLTDQSGGAIRKIAAANGAISTVIGGLNNPVDLALDASGDIFFIEKGDNALKELPAAGGAVVTLATVTNPSALAMDAAGNFYIGDQQDNLVYKVAAGGASPVTIGSGFNTLEDIATDAAGDVFVTEGTGTGVKMIPATGGTPISVVSFSGQAEADGITTDASGDIFYCNYFGGSNTANITKNARTGGYTTLDMLPAGVTVDYTTGVISGTPTSGSPAKNYRIIGYNSLGGNLALVNIGVKSSYLTNLAPNTGAISPVFSAATANYTMTVCNATNTIALTPTASDPTATIKINGATVPSGSASTSIALGVGSNAITITSINTDTSTYTLTVNRLAGPSVAITGAFCQSCSPQALTFTAKVTDGGSTSNYTWYKNNVVVGTNDSTYIDNALVTNDQVWCTITSNATCTLANTVTSNIVTLAAPGIVSVSPASGPAGTLVTVNGSNFETLTSLTIAGAPAIPVTNYGTRITAMIMPAASAGAASATTIFGTASGGNFTIGLATPPSFQQGSKLTVSATPASTGFGRTMAISADGNTAISTISVSGAGEMVIFTRSNSAWTQQAILTATGATGNFVPGTAVALSADGNTALVGGQLDNNAMGAVWVFTRSNGVWTQQGNKLTASDAVSGSAGSYFGSAVALSADGNTALIGGTNDNNYTGAAWIFNRSSTGVWTQNGSKLTGSGASGTAMLGNAVALSADGNTALVDGHNDGFRLGAVWVFTNNNGTWTQQGSKLAGTGTTGTTGAEQGISLAVSADGNTAFWGGFHDNGGVGAAWVFTRSGSTWTQQGAKLVGTGIVKPAGVTNINFGQSVSLSADGNIAVVGAPDDNSYTGAMWVFTCSNGSWSQYGNKLVGANEVVKNSSVGFGQAVALSADGSTAVAGDPSDNNFVGAVWAYIHILPAPLTSLALSSGTLSPVFSAGTNSYTANVTNATSSVTLTPAVADPNATIKVNGMAVTSGAATAPISLNVGANTISIVTTAQDGLTLDTYSVTITRAASANARLSKITLSAGTLSPAFSANTASYTATVSNATTSIMLTPTTTESHATVTVNGAAVTSGSPSDAIALNIGVNTITIVVTAQNGATTATYTVTVTRAESSDATLSDLTISSGTLAPAFSGTRNNYSASVGNSVMAITITPTTNDANANITVNGVATASGMPSQSLPLAVGTNTITTIVTAQDGITTDTYTITVTRAPSSNAKLASLAISSGVLSPAFKAATAAYTASVTPDISTITLTPTAAVTGATIIINGIAVTSGSPSGAIPLNTGDNAITIIVTAPNGNTTQTYTLTVNRPPSAYLSALSLNTGTLSPAFSAAAGSYTETVAGTVTAVRVKPTAADPNATIKVNGTTVASGGTSGAINLNVGSNTITVMVTATDGVTTNTYTINAIRPSANANLAALSLNTGFISPAFNTGTTGYTETVPNTVTAVRVKATTADANATIKVNGTKMASGSTSQAISLSVGANTITTVVTAQNGIATMTYTITVTRSAGALNALYEPVGVEKPTETPQLNSEITIHQAVSPNGDGQNDVLTIDNIKAYPDNTLRIMTRAGELVFEAKGYDNAAKAFDGHSNKTGQLQKPGTYFYSLDYLVNGIIKHKTGFIVLKY